MSIFKKGRPSHKEPPPKPGLYSKRDRSTKKVLYYGETNNLRRRKREHKKSGKISPERHIFAWKKADGRSTSRTRRIVEKNKINKHRPVENQRRGGGGRRGVRFRNQRGAEKKRFSCCLLPWLLSIALPVALILFVTQFV